jgi:YlmC/YmxH family sporulation protein
MRCCITDLKNKEVVNVIDGKFLGYVCDMELDLINGKLCSIIVPDDKKGGGALGLCFFKGGGEIIIPWDRIEKIGEDIILVNIDAGSYSRDLTDADKKRKGSFFS